MRFSVLATVLSLCAVFATASPVPEPIPAFNPNEVYIEGITYAGSGCPHGSADISITNGGKNIVIDFDDHFCIPPPLSKNCNINFKVHYPQGYSFTLFQTEYIGFVDLPNGQCKATLDSSYWFAGFPQSSFQKVWTGPVSQNFDITDAFTQEKLVWCPCGASTTLNLNTRITLNRNGCGVFCVDKIKQKVRAIFGIQWRQC